jgi:hypothetical protein
MAGSHPLRHLSDNLFNQNTLSPHPSLAICLLGALHKSPDARFQLASTQQVFLFANPITPDLLKAQAAAAAMST